MRDRLTDMQEIENNLFIVKKYPRNVSKNMKKIYLLQNWRYPYTSLFQQENKPTSDWQTYKNFWIIWNWPANIPEMSWKNLRKISHPELEITLYLYNFSKEVSQITDLQTYKNLNFFEGIPLMFVHLSQIILNSVCLSVCLLAYFLTEIIQI